MTPARTDGYLDCARRQAIIKSFEQYSAGPALYVTESRRARDVMGDGSSPLSECEPTARGRAAVDGAANADRAATTSVNATLESMMLLARVAEDQALFKSSQSPSLHCASGWGGHAWPFPRVQRCATHIS